MSVRIIVTICGSMRFFSRMLEVAAEETSKGKIVLMPYVKKSGEKTEAADLDELHRDKLRMSQEAIFVVGPEHYMGISTRGEYAFAVEELGIVVWQDDQEATHA